MGHIFNTGAPRKAPRKPAKAKPRIASKEGARRFDFVIVSLPTSEKERRLLAKNETALIKRVQDAVKAGDVYADFAASPQEQNRAVFLLRKAEGAKKYPPQLMRIL